MDFSCLDDQVALTLEITIFTIFCLFSIVTIGTAIMVFGFKSKIERPKFVTWQTIFLGIRCICFGIYLLLKYLQLETKDGENRDHIANALATTGDICFLLHDWIFTEQYVAASLNMPIIIKIFSEGN